jgi:hypothetical protein
MSHFHGPPSGSSSAIIATYQDAFVTGVAFFKEMIVGKTIPVTFLIFIQLSRAIAERTGTFKGGGYCPADKFGTVRYFFDSLVQIFIHFECDNFFFIHEAQLLPPRLQ